MRAARKFSSRVFVSLKIEIFPYSVFYIFFEQYLDIWKTSLINLAIAIGFSGKDTTQCDPLKQNAMRGRLDTSLTFVVSRRCRVWGWISKPYLVYNTYSTLFVASMLLTVQDRGRSREYLQGSFWSAIILLVLAMIVVDLMGVMAILNIQLNAITVLNPVMAVGIAVEFCVHITHAFLVSSGDRNQRTTKALGTMGASVFSGITLTKLVGVIVLCFSRT